MSTITKAGRYYRVIQYTTKFKGRQDTVLGMFLLHVDASGAPMMAFPVDVTGKTQAELSQMIAGMWAANQLPPLEYPYIIDWDWNEDQVLVWNEATLPTGAGRIGAAGGAN